MARSRPRLPALSRAVVAEVLEAPGADGLAGNDRLRSLIGTLVQAYTVGIFSSNEIESNGLGRQSWVGKTEPAASASELERVRGDHRDLLTHCLARVYSQAWRACEPPAIKQFGRPDSQTEAHDEEWDQALTEARHRIEWAYLADLTNRKKS